jgi:hypothetical protein
MHGQLAVNSFRNGQLAGSWQRAQESGVIQTVLAFAQLEQFLLKPA